MRRIGIVIAAVFAVSGFGYALAALAAGPDTGTASVCATVSWTRERRRSPITNLWS